jgi:UDP-N-acetyl-D-mannosaminuronate dehydrogenase
MNTLKNLLKKIEQKNFTLGVIGLRYVGLPMSLTFLRKEYQPTEDC